MRLHRAALESCRVMQRIPNLLFRLLSLMVVLAIFGFIQVSVAQNSDPVQDATHQGNEPRNHRELPLGL